MAGPDGYFDIHRDEAWRDERARGERGEGEEGGGWRAVSESKIN